MYQPFEVLSDFKLGKGFHVTAIYVNLCVARKHIFLGVRI